MGTGDREGDCVLGLDKVLSGGNGDGCSGATAGGGVNEEEGSGVVSTSISVGTSRSISVDVLDMLDLKDKEDWRGEGVSLSNNVGSWDVESSWLVGTGLGPRIWEW